LNLNPTLFAVLFAGMGIALLGGCAAQQPGRAPIVDMQGVDPARYEADLAECRQYSQQVAVGKDTATGALVGAALGGVAGAAARDSDTAKRAAGVGAVVGGAHGALSGVEERDRVVRTCLRNRGYVVLN
jgi:outer membrane lipoprotein SlyB